jgi:hypothetical protein
VPHKSDKDDRATWSNAHADIMSRVNMVEPERLALQPTQPTDEKYGTASQLLLRYLGRVKELDDEVRKVSAIYNSERDANRKSHFYTIVDALEREIEVVVGLYTEQFKYEPEVKGWGGPPLYTVREGGIVVIRAKQRRFYEEQIILNVMPITMDAHNLYRTIALDCFKRR